MLFLVVNFLISGINCSSEMEGTSIRDFYSLGLKLVHSFIIQIFDEITSAGRPYKALEKTFAICLLSLPLLSQYTVSPVFKPTSFILNFT